MGQATEPVEKDLFIDMLSNEEEMGRASESVEDTLIVGLNSGKETIVSNTSTVSTGSTVVMSAHAPEFARELTARGLTLLQPEIHELVKGGGYIRCTTLTLE